MDHDIICYLNYGMCWKSMIALFSCKGSHSGWAGLVSAYILLELPRYVLSLFLEEDTCKAYGMVNPSSHDSTSLGYERRFLSHSG